MSSNEENLERIDKFIRGKMTFEEKRAFETEMSNDQKLREQVELCEVINQMIIGEEALKIKEKIRNDLKKPSPGSGSYITPLLLLLGAIATASWLFLNKTEKNNRPVTTLRNQEIIQAAPAKPFENVPPPAKRAIKEPEVIFNLPQSKPTVPNSIQEIISNIPLQVSPQQALIPDSNRTTPALEKIPQNISHLKYIDSCFQLGNHVDFVTVPSCKGEETGEVHIKSESLKGGTPPYSFTLNDRTSNYYFDRLPAGRYNLIIRDAKNCSVENATSVVIAEIQCNNIQFVFNPEFDNYWAIPFNKDKKPLFFKIFDKGGRIFYQTPVKDYQPSEWNGSSNTGMLLGTELYFFRIEYEDNTTEKGSILISR